MMMLQMEVQPMEPGGESRCSSSSSMDEDTVGCGWNSRAPVTPVYDWGQFSSDDDFHGLIESMICEDSEAVEAVLSQKLSPCSSFRSCTTTETDTPTSVGKKDSSSPELSTGKSLSSLPEDGRGLRLVHLLMAAAEAMTGPHMSRELSKVILVRLKEMVPAAAAAGGSNMERLAGHFTDALLCLLDGGGGGRQSATPHREEQHHPGDVMAAFQLLQDMSPYVKFGHFTANQAILEAVAGERRVHIIDYDIMEGVQWASLIQALVSRGGGGLPPAHLRITAVTRGGAGRRGLGTVQETGRRLVAFAAAVGQPFSFGQCRVDADDQFRPAGVKVVKGEVVVANCVLQPPQAARKSVASFLAGVAALGARVVAVVEEESEAAAEGGFVGRFMEELQRYSAVWDSLEAGFPMQGKARGLVEKVVLGPRIAGAVAAAFRDGERGSGWGESMAGMGYGRVGISWFNHCQARLLLGLFNDGYRVEEAAPNKLVLAWKARRLLSASVWAAPAGAGEGAGLLC